MRAQRIVMFAIALALLIAPRSARAETLLTPFAGITFGGSGDSTGSFGVSLAFMGAGIFGVEGEIGYTPSFFDTSSFDFIDSDNVVTVMGNLIIGIPVGGTDGGGIKPYLTGGIGILKTDVNSVGGVFEGVSNTDFGFNVGAGLMGFFNDHVGLRGDIRYFRGLTDPDEDNEFDIAVGDLDFWRGSLGLTFRF